MYRRATGATKIMDVYEMLSAVQFERDRYLEAYIYLVKNLDNPFAIAEAKANLKTWTRYTKLMEVGINVRYPVDIPDFVAKDEYINLSDEEFEKFVELRRDK
jgi:hypothetical protein